MANNRFNQITKNRIAARAGYRCSFPGCNKTLIGPGPLLDSITNIGDCAHIFSAEKNGPRGNGGLSENQITNQSNGIYLCKHHHKIIDTNNGIKYPARILMQYKAKHEHNISLEIGDNIYFSDWISSFSITKSDLFKKKLEIYLVKVTLLYGDNASGKTYCGELLYSSITGEPLERFYEKKHEVELRVDSFDQPISISIYKDQVKYVSQGLDSNFNTMKTEVVYLRKIYKNRKDQVKSIAKCFGVSDYIIQRLLVKSNFKHSPWISDIKVETRRYKPYLARNVFIKTIKNGVKSDYFVNLGMCGSAELELLLAEIGIILSRLLSKRSPTLYILESFNLNTLDDNYTEQIINELQNINNPFQSIIISPNKNSKITWTGWEIARFYKICPNTVIQQDSLL